MSKNRCLRDFMSPLYRQTWMQSLFQGHLQRSSNTSGKTSKRKKNCAKYMRWANQALVKRSLLQWQMCVHSQEKYSNPNRICIDNANFNAPTFAFILSVSTGVYLPFTGRTASTTFSCICQRFESILAVYLWDRRNARSVLYSNK